MIANIKHKTLGWAFENIYKPAHAAKLGESGIAFAAESIKSFVTLVGCDPPISEITAESLREFERFIRSQGFSATIALCRRQRIQAIIKYVIPPKPDVTAGAPDVGTLRHYISMNAAELWPESLKAKLVAARAFCRFLGRDVLLRDVTPENILEFQSSLKPSQGNAYAGAVRTVMRTIDPMKFRVHRDRRFFNRYNAKANKPTSGSTWLLINLYLKEYEPLKLRSRRPNTKRLYRCTLRQFDKFLGRDANLDDFRESVLNDFANWRLAQGRTKNSVNRNLWDLLAFWRWCCGKGYVDQRPDFEIDLAPKETPIAWTQAEMLKLYRSLATLPGSIGVFPAADWWQALLLVIWCSGERIGAVMALDWSRVNLREKWLRFPADDRKGGRNDSLVRFDDETGDALERIQTSAGPVFPWPHTPSYLWNKYSGILRRADLPCDRQSKFHRLRKTVASHAEAAGGNAGVILRHADHRVTERYLDPRIVKRQQPNDVLFRLTK